MKEHVRERCKELYEEREGLLDSLGGFSKPSLGHLGAILGTLGGSWEPSWALLEPLGDLLDALGGFSKPSWGHLGAILGLLGASGGPLLASWGHLGAILGRSWGNPGASWNPVEKHGS